MIQHLHRLESHVKVTVIVGSAWPTLPPLPMLVPVDFFLFALPYLEPQICKLNLRNFLHKGNLIGDMKRTLSTAHDSLGSELWLDLDLGLGLEQGVELVLRLGLELGVGLGPLLGKG